MKSSLTTIPALMGSAILSASVAATPITTDIVAVVDESGSMGGEHAWLPGMMSSLHGELSVEAGADPFSVQYGLVGYGSYGSDNLGSVADMDPLAGGTQQFGSVSQFGQAANDQLETYGSTEDGYAGLDTALGYTGQPGALRNYMLVTDEDRDNVSTDTYSSIAAQLADQNALLNAALDVSIACGDETTALGLDATGTGYIADGSGGFTTCGGAFMFGGDGASISDYGQLALNTGGAVWDLNQLREGGLTAESFTSAFVDVKVQETTDRVGVPEPSSILMLGAGLLGLSVFRRRIRQS